MTLLKLLAIAVVYAALSIWLYAYTPVEATGLVATVPFAFGMNVYVLHSAFAGRLRPVDRWLMSIALAAILTFLTMWAYMVYVLNNYPN
jgi:hypothetical protein